MSLPLELPEKPPSTWKMNLMIHFNFGGGKGAAMYEIRDEHGTVMPFTFGYNTKEGWRGFKFPKSDKVWTWPEIRAKWPEWMKKKLLWNTTANHRSVQGQILVWLEEAVQSQKVTKSDEEFQLVVTSGKEKQA